MTTALPHPRCTQLRLLAIEQELPTGRPLVPISALMVRLDKSEDDVKWLYEAGYLRFAFDLGSAQAKRSEVRVYRGSVVDYLAGRISHLTPSVRSETEQAALGVAITACLPPGGGPVDLSRLGRLWTVSSTHLHNLVDARQLAALPGQTLKATQTPKLDRASVVAFLKQRKIA